VVTAAETSSEPNKILGIVITGGTKGVGYALTREFLGAGDRVVLCGRSEERVAAAIDALRAEFPGAQFHVSIEGDPV
jgi:short-subunit dehydrogenase involved in D-alanine esterification of teichoic acids